MSYHQERTSSTAPSEGDNSHDPSAGGLFTVDFRKHEDLKNMLDSNKDGLKLDAMKRIVGMVAKGKNASHLFPAVVKNVACKNIEVKKLVYVYLERYAEEQQDLALLSISTFQRGLKDQNQLIRASALRVLSSIRVSIIVPIMMLAIKEAVNDMSPFVRKTAAHAIPKLYSLDPEQKENLIEVLEKLLNDRTTLVAGSVVMAFQELCPERVDLVHKHYRKLCTLLVDVDEWGQIAILNMLTRYARTQFLDPNKFDDGEDEIDKPFYEDDEEKHEKKDEKPKYIMDTDHRLLLKCAKPLLQSRNAAVVMTVAQLFYHVAPRKEVNVVAKALVRLLRSYREVQAIVLQNIASMSLTSKSSFSPFLKSFYVRSTDPTHIRILKLEVLTNLASESNISTILREFQTYVRSSDRQFVAHTIQAIGRCAANITEVTDTCLNGLVGLLSNRDETVVAESIVVIKKLLQMNPSQHQDIIKHMGKLFVTVQVPMAKASILWLIGEYTEHVPRIAPDVLRQAAKNFIQEEDIVKLQIVNLAAKLYVTNHKQTKLLTQYVLQLAKYDQNYDIRDRARFLRHLVMPSQNGGVLHKHAKKILLAPKPAPVLDSPFKDREIYQLGSLSHCLNTEANGYQKLPDFPEVQPDPTVRNVELPDWEKKKVKGRLPQKTIKKRSFYSDEDPSSSSGGEDSSSSGTEDSDSDSETGSESSSISTEGPDSRVSESDKLPETPPSKSVQSYASTESSSGTGSSSSGTESDSGSSSSGSPSPPPVRKSTKSKPKAKEVSLLDLDDFDSPMPPPGQNSASKPMAMLSPTLTSDLQGLSLNSNASGGYTSPTTTNPYYSGGTKYELLHRITGEGLSATYRFTRNPCIYGDKMITIELSFFNQGDAPIKDVSMGDKKLQSGLKVHDFSKIDIVQPGTTCLTTFGVDFCDTLQPLVFDLCTSSRKFNVNIKVPVGELIQPIMMSEDEFVKQQKKLSGMNENAGKISIKPSEKRSEREVCKSVVEVVNIGRVPSAAENMFRFAGKTASKGEVILIQLDLSSASDDVPASVKVNCEKMVVGSLILKKLKEVFS